MKKWIMGSLLLVALMVVAAGVYAQTSDKEKKDAKKECTFVDNNKDGKCDTCGSTAEACKKEASASKECSTAAGKDCSKCPAAAGCAGAASEVVPAQGTTSGGSCCPAKK